MKIYIGTDHGGFEFKKKIVGWLKKWGHEVEDMGAYELDPLDDYPDFIVPVANGVVFDRDSLGIVLGRSGNGEAICANKVKGVRAALCLNETMAEKAREHNNANVLSLGADFIDTKTTKKIIKKFIETPFSTNEKYLRRIKKEPRIPKT